MPALTLGAEERCAHAFTHTFYLAPTSEGRRCLASASADRGDRAENGYPELRRLRPASEKRLNHAGCYVRFGSAEWGALARSFASE